jgi:MoxR-like ATPase
MTTQKSTKSKVETLTLKPSEIAAAIRAAGNTMVSTFVWGAPGISKSAVAQQVATADNKAFIDIRLSQMDPTDLRGIPYPVDGEEGVRWSAPIVLPRDLDLDLVAEIDEIEAVIKFRNPTGSNKIHYVTEPKVEVFAVKPGLTAELVETGMDRFVVCLKNDKGELVEGKVHYKVTGKATGILALEEFNSAPPSVQAAAYQLVLDRALGEYEVPDGVQIVGMGNRDTDKGITFKMPTPIMNRFIHLEMRPDFDDWQRWALGARINSDVVGYLSAFKQKLFEFEPGSAARGFATPRSWSFVSEILNNNDDMLEQVAVGLLAGAVGDAAGIEFMEFRKIAQDLPSAESILSGALKTMPKKTEISLAYALTTTLCYELKERADEVRRKGGASWHTTTERKRWMFEADNFLEFIMVNMQPEICIMGAKAAISIHKLPFDTQKMKHFDTFAGKFKDLIMS